jgi:cytochrome c-type biogenesis protein CcmH
MAQPGPAAGEPGAGPGAASPAGAAASDARATVNISIAPQLKGRLTQEAPLFVFAREPGGQGPPLAAKRLTSAAIGTQIQLSAADSMIPSRVLVNGTKVSITARVSFSGQPLPAKGDLYGEVTYDVGTDGVRDLVINQVAE